VCGRGVVWERLISQGGELLGRVEFGFGENFGGEYMRVRGVPTAATFFKAY
jgi:hypothetical protein